MMCPRCHGLMYATELQDWHGGTGQDHCPAFRCIACGEIVDHLILLNRSALLGRSRAGRNRVRHDNPLRARLIKTLERPAR
jgi:hypothetical protein